MAPPGFRRWRSTQSHHNEHDRRIFLKERRAACPYGQQKNTYQRSHERPFTLFMNVQPFARVRQPYAKICTSSRSDLMTFRVRIQ